MRLEVLRSSVFKYVLRKLRDWEFEFVSLPVSWVILFSGGYKSSEEEVFHEITISIKINQRNNTNLSLYSPLIYLLISCFSYDFLRHVKFCELVGVKNRPINRIYERFHYHSTPHMS